MVTIDELVTLNVIKPLPISPSPYTLPTISLGLQAPTPPMKDLRKEKCVINNLTTNIKGVALYRGMETERLDHHMD